MNSAIDELDLFEMRLENENYHRYELLTFSPAFAARLQKEGYEGGDDLITLVNPRQRVNIVAYERCGY